MQAGRVRRFEVVGGDVSLRPPHTGRVLLQHKDWPDWVIKVNFGSEGRVVGVTVMPAVEVTGENVEEHGSVEDFLLAAQLHLWPSAPGLTASGLRALTDGLDGAATSAFRALVRGADRDWRAFMATPEAQEIEERIAKQWKAVGLPNSPPPAGPDGLSDLLDRIGAPRRAGQRSELELAQIAQLYVDLEDDDLLATTAETVGLPDERQGLSVTRTNVLARLLHLSPGSVVNLISTLRRDPGPALLTKTTRGKGGGNTTMRCKDILMKGNQ